MKNIRFKGFQFSLQSMDSKWGRFRDISKYCYRLRAPWWRWKLEAEMDAEVWWISNRLNSQSHRIFQGLDWGKVIFPPVLELRCFGVSGNSEDLKPRTHRASWGNKTSLPFWWGQSCVVPSPWKEFPEWSSGQRVSPWLAPTPAHWLQTHN